MRIFLCRAALEGDGVQGRDDLLLVIDCNFISKVGKM
jgi:hypothetical protein